MINEFRSCLDWLNVVKSNVDKTLWFGGSGETSHKARRSRRFVYVTFKISAVFGSSRAQCNLNALGVENAPASGSGEVIATFMMRLRNE